MLLQRINYAKIILLVCIGLLALNIPISQTEAQTLQCPVATWRIYDDSCYRLSTRSDTYNDATKACVDEGAVLTSILTSDEQSFLTDMAEQKEVWIGLNDKKKEGDFKWVDGSNYEYTHWGNGQPNDGCLLCYSEDCVHMKSNGKWNDLLCGGLKYYICKSHAIPLPTTTEDTFTDHTSAVSSQGLITSTTTTFNPGSTSSYSDTPDQPELTPEYISTPLTEPQPTATDSRSIGPGGPDKQRDSPPTGLIAGVIVGAVLLIVIVVILVLWFRRSRSTQYPMKEQSFPSGQAYVGPYELTIDGINDGVVIQSNSNVKYETNTINDETPTAYENLSTIQQHQEMTSGDNVYAAVDVNGANSPSGFDNQVSVIYAKPIKNNLKQLHHDESTLPSNPEDVATVDVKSDSAKGFCEGSLSPATVQRECNEEEEGWHDNELYGDLNEGDVDEGLNAMAMQHMSETPAANVKEDATNKDAGVGSDEDTGWEDNIIYGETQHTPDTVKDKDDGEDEGWEENKIYSRSDN